ncbi:MAG: trypsin-like peptidase domain-containing protein [Anaerolineae bacterium]|nr:S1C family serine protease [Thermoflexales bacterium]MDW8394695.1 trypsin-like peptidase domain-containing protein [Anaerolineae bacterium]
MLLKGERAVSSQGAEAKKAAPVWRQRIRPLALFGAGIAAALVAVLLRDLLVPSARPLSPREVAQIAALVMASATPPPPNAVLVYRAIQPSLVLIRAEIPRRVQADQRDSIGAGVIVSERGDVLTSLHVVEGAQTITLTFADGTESEGRIINARPENDIAVLRAVNPPQQIVPAVLGSPGSLRIGDEAYVVGHPLGLSSSLSAGVISGLNRTFKPTNSPYRLEGLIQFDAAVNPGSSGGPLLNQYGQVVGIVVGLVNPADVRAFAGISFAVPIDVAGGAAGLPPY